MAIQNDGGGGYRPRYKPVTTPIGPVMAPQAAVTPRQTTRSISSVSKAPTYTESGGGGGGGGGGGFGGSSAATAAPAAPPPPPMKDVDWFNQDSIYRNQAGSAGADLMDQLSQLLYQRGQGYQGIDNQRRDWGMERDEAQEATGEDFAARGLLSSGMYKSALDQLLADFESEQGQINSAEQDLTQQFGQRDSLAGGIDQDSLLDNNYTALADIYGLLGNRGVQAGTGYNNSLNRFRAESAGRSTEKLTNTLNW